MLKSTQAIAGIIGSNRARPRLSLPSASCCAAMAGSAELMAEKMAPAMAVSAREGIEVSDCFEEEMSLGRVWIERREMGFGGGGLELRFGFFGVVVKHLGLRMAIVVVMVPAIGVALFWVFSFSG
ncbi:hypothetical protein Vadar_006671 [Vaccinium darrowii]|uniref:Uncharacterized protein n=1 Tax=Vaccinium darrowii TaxID=229202 RepID=A0ACB7YT86_9ERIC|nr:hypothetical protein Vadar_006671 [Vaccinium darrowii]